MEQGHAQDKLRAQLRSPLGYKVFNVLFALVFGVGLVLTAVNNPNTAMEFSPLYLAVCAVAGAGVVYALLLLASRLPELPKLAERIALPVLFVGLFALQLALGSQTMAWPVQPVQQQGGFDSVFMLASNYVQNRTPVGPFFTYFPALRGMYTVLFALFTVLKNFGVENPLFATVVLNAMAIDASLLMMYLMARKTFGKTKALFLLLGGFVSLPLLLHLPILSAATLCLPVCAGMALLWMQTRVVWRSGRYKQALPRFGAVSLLAGVGVLLQPAVLFLWCAIFLDLLLLLRGKGRLKVALAGFAVVALVCVGGTMALRTAAFMPEGEGADTTGVPPTQWVMAGLADDDTQYESDLMETVGRATYAQRETHIDTQLKSRFGQMGPGGFVRHLGDKLGFLLGDGTYSAERYYAKYGATQPALPALVNPQSDVFGPTGYLAYAMQAALLLMMVVGAVKAIVRDNDCFTFMRVALVALVLFLLAWQAYPRDLLCFLPLCLLGALEAGPPSVAQKKLAYAQFGEGPAAMTFVQQDAPAEEYEEIQGPNIEDLVQMDMANGQLYEEMAQTQEDASPAVNAAPGAAGDEELYTTAFDSAAQRPISDGRPEALLGGKARGGKTVAAQPGGPALWDLAEAEQPSTQQLLDAVEAAMPSMPDAPAPEPEKPAGEEVPSNHRDSLAEVVLDAGNTTQAHSWQPLAPKKEASCAEQPPRGFVEGKAAFTLLQPGAPEEGAVPEESVQHTPAPLPSREVWYAGPNYEPPAAEALDTPDGTAQPTAHIAGREQVRARKELRAETPEKMPAQGLGDATQTFERNHDQPQDVTDPTGRADDRDSAAFAPVPQPVQWPRRPHSGTRAETEHSAQPASPGKRWSAVGSSVPEHSTANAAEMDAAGRAARPAPVYQAGPGGRAAAQYTVQPAAAPPASRPPRGQRREQGSYAALEDSVPHSSFEPEAAEAASPPVRLSSHTRGQWRSVGSSAAGQQPDATQREAAYPPNVRPLPSVDAQAHQSRYTAARGRHTQREAPPVETVQNMEQSARQVVPKPEQDIVARRRAQRRAQRKPLRRAAYLPKPDGEADR